MKMYQILDGIKQKGYAKPVLLCECYQLFTSRYSSLVHLSPCSTRDLEAVPVVHRPARGGVLSTLTMKYFSKVQYCMPK
jgi:hypothetical protein